MVSSRSEVKYREGYGPSDNHSHELDASPDLAPLEEQLEVRPGRGRIRKVSPSGNRRSTGREALRLFVYGLIIMTIGGVAFASQYGDDNIKEALGIMQSTVSRLFPDLGENPPPRVVEGFSKSSDQASMPNKMPAKDARFTQSSPVSVTAGSSAQIQQQLESMAGELAIVRGLAEQLMVSQKKMTQDIAALETAKESLSQKMWWLYQSSTLDAPPHKSVKKPVASTTAKPPPAPNPAARPQTP